jgi:hypothetical protein
MGFAFRFWRFNGGSRSKTELESEDVSATSSLSAVKSDDESSLSELSEADLSRCARIWALLEDSWDYGARVSLLALQWRFKEVFGIGVRRCFGNIQSVCCQKRR